MLTKAFAVLAEFSSIALPIVALSIHAVMEAQIPHCRIDLPASEPICTDAVTGLKFEHQFRRSGMLASIS